MKIKILIIAALCNLSAIANGYTREKGEGSKDSDQKAEVTQWMHNSGGISFLENKGQLTDMNGKSLSSLLFKTSGGGADMYVTTSGLSYLFTHIEKQEKANRVHGKYNRHKYKEDESKSSYCRADMELVGADIEKENIIKEDESNNYCNYYIGKSCPGGVLNVRSYQRITVKNIYPGIDWVLYSFKTGQGGLKYNFIVHPGADPSLIKLRYKWTDKPELQKDGSLKINTPMGNIAEGVPISYGHSSPLQGEQEGLSIPTHYIIQDNEISFNVAQYNKNQMLVIDPTLVWSTFYGGQTMSPEFSQGSMQYDGFHVYVTGFFEYPQGLPTVNPGGGAYFIGTLSNNYQNFILQFTTAGVLRWATYFGGTASFPVTVGGINTYLTDNVLAIASDGSHVWVTGTTVSTDFPIDSVSGSYFQGTMKARTGAIDSTFSGNAFISKFDTFGVLKWSTYYGGSGGDEGLSIQSDGSHVWITGQTYSTDFPIQNLTGAYNQPTNGSGSYGNSFILEFDTSGAPKWATYYGGVNGGSYGNSIQSDGVHLWMTGQTTQNDFPIENLAGAYNQPANGSDAGNAFILDFDAATSARIWATYYGGNSTGNGLGDAGNSINSDGASVWVTGYTSSTTFPTFNPGGETFFQGTIGVGGNSATDATFILQFNTDGVQKWATYYGGSSGVEDDQGYQIQSDGTNVWVNGGTHCHNFPTLNPGGCGGYFQDSLEYPGEIAPQPPTDQYILQFTTTGVRKWATYLGYDYEDEGSGISSDGKNVFVCGTVEDTVYPLVNPGGSAYFYDSISPDKSTFIAKFCIACATDNVSISSSPSICPSSSTALTASGSVQYNWIPSTGLSSTIIANPTANPTVTTTYTVTGSSGGCNAKDSVTVTVDPNFILTVSHDTIIRSGGSANLKATGGATYQWWPITNLSCSSCANPVASPTVTTTYSVEITNGCSRDTSVTVTVIPSGIQVITDKNAISIYPNPCNGKFTIQSSVISDRSLVEVYNMLGEKVLTETLHSAQGDNSIDLSSQPNGIYLYRVITENGELVGEGKVVIAK